jgi:uncharacterized membrane protein
LARQENLNSEKDMFSLYLTLKFIHVVAVIFWIGGVMAMSVFTFRAARASQPALAVTIGHAIFYGQKVVGPLSGVVLLAGIVMVIRAKIGFMTPWVLWGFSGIAIHILLGVTVIRKNSERLLQLASAALPDTAALGAALRRQRSLVTIYLFIMLSTIWAMVVKPA